jgi:hypothetical protein
MSAKAVVGKLSKPQLRGHVKSYIRTHLTIASVLALSAAISWKYLVAEPRKAKYAEFYKYFLFFSHYFSFILLLINSIIGIMTSKKKNNDSKVLVFTTTPFRAMNNSIIGFNLIINTLCLP